MKNSFELSSRTAKKTLKRTAQTIVTTKKMSRRVV
jgi:hypothetical protein